MSKQKSKLLPDEMRGKMTIWQYDMHRATPRREHFPQWPTDYSLIAALDTTSLDQAFVWTNDFDGWQRDEVSILPPFGWDTLEFEEETVHQFFCPRSSSVGDVFVAPDGKAFLVENFGFREIGTCV